MNTVTKKVQDNVIDVVTVNAGNGVSFKTIFKLNAEGLREFEIRLSSNSNSMNDVFNHSFYKECVIPWSLGNEVDLSKYKSKKEPLLNNVVNFKR